MRTATNVRTASLLAYRSIEPSLQDREREIIRFLARNAHRDFTRRELAVESGIDLCSLAQPASRAPLSVANLSASRSSPSISTLPASGSITRTGSRGCSRDDL